MEISIYLSVSCAYFSIQSKCCDCLSSCVDLELLHCRILLIAFPNLRKSCLGCIGRSLKLPLDLSFFLSFFNICFFLDSRGLLEIFWLAFVVFVILSIDLIMQVRSI